MALINCIDCNTEVSTSSGDKIEISHDGYKNLSTEMP